jgi:hypothetical protein
MSSCCNSTKDLRDGGCDSIEHRLELTDDNELIDSVREAGRILRGEAALSREFSHSVPKT